MMCSIRSCLFWFVIGACLVAYNECSAKDVNYSDRGDRFEGVITRKDISGDYFNLLGIQIVNGEHFDPSSSHVNLSFWNPSPANIHIEVFHPKKNYWMFPKKENYAGGSQVFTWPVETVIKPLKLNVAELHVRVKDISRNLFSPARIFTGTQTMKGNTYRFSFESEGGVELKGSILREDNNILMPVKQFELVEDYPGVVCITWDGLDQKGEKVPTGVYRLCLKGSIYLRESEEPLTRDIAFMHNQNIYE